MLTDARVSRLQSLELTVTVWKVDSKVVETALMNIQDDYVETVVR